MFKTFIEINKSDLQKKRLVRRNYRFKEGLSIYSMIAVPYLFFVVFVIYPLLWVLRYAFYYYDGVQSVFVGLDNFKTLMVDTIWWQSVYNTLIYTFFNVAIGIPLALLVAVLLNLNLKGSIFYKTVFYIPCLISSAIIGIIFRIMLAPSGGIINEILMKIGIVSEPVYILKSGFAAMTAVISISIWQSLGYNMTLILAGLQKIPPELYEAASIDGAKSWDKFIYITIPQLGMMLRIITMLSILGSLKIFDLVNVLTNGMPNHGTETIVTYIFKYFFETEGTRAQQGYAASASVVASVILGIITLIYFKSSKNVSED